MKVNWAYLKKPSVIIGAIVLFFILLFMLNKGSSASSGTTVVNSGPSDAQVSAQTQLAMAQIGAGVQSQALQLDYAKSQDANATQLALAQAAAVLQGQSLVVQQNIANQTIAAQVHGLDLQYQTALANNDFALNYAKNQFDYGLASQTINANLQSELSANQLTAYKINVLSGLAANAGHDKIPGSGAMYIQALAQTGPSNSTSYIPNYGSNSGGGGTNLLNIVSPITSLF